MIVLPWTLSGSPDSATVAQVTRLELRRFRHVPGFLIEALRIRRAAQQAPGAIGITLRAAPLRRSFWTLSIWTDQASVDAFVSHETHLATMRRFRSRMAGSRFLAWQLEPGTSPPTWDHALQRLDNDT